MAVEALCPICGAVFSLKEEMQGKKVRCTKCEHVFTVGGESKAKAKEREDKETGVKTKADLRGKRIAFTAGTGSEVYTATLLKSAGLTAKDVTLVNLRPQEMLPALAAGSIDAIGGKLLIDGERGRGTRVSGRVAVDAA